jgi:putative membrane protein
VFKLGVYACLGLFVSWVLLLILQLWFSFIDADLFLKITLDHGRSFHYHSGQFAGHQPVFFRKENEG